MITLAQNSNLNPTQIWALTGSENSFLSPGHQFQAINLRSSPGQCPGCEHNGFCCPLPQRSWAQIGQELHCKKASVVRDSPLTAQFVKLCTLKEIKIAPYQVKDGEVILVVLVNPTANSSSVFIVTGKTSEGNYLGGLCQNSCSMYCWNSSNRRAHFGGYRRSALFGISIFLVEV